MKYNQTVLNRVYKYRERKGIKITDTDSSVFKTFKIMYILALIWFFATDLLYILGCLLALSEPSTSNRVLMTPFIMVSCATAVILVATLLVLKFKAYIVGTVASFIAFCVSGYEFYNLLVDRSGLEKINTQFWLRHGISAMIAIICCVVICIVAVRARVKLNNDYKRVLEILYINNKEKLATANDEEWQTLVDELDDGVISGKVSIE